MRPDTPNKSLACAGVVGPGCVLASGARVLMSGRPFEGPHVTPGRQLFGRQLLLAMLLAPLCANVLALW